ncbi:MAG: MFS transporter [Proteobacteria bacterium]|nr:MFS transporter [Pseudomonadota bacterium]
MTTSTHLLRSRRFVPLFVTQMLGAFNDNLYRYAVVYFLVFNVFNDEKQEGNYSALASGLLIAPFLLLSAVSGQLADTRDKAVIIRWVKLCEIGIMLVGGAGLLLAWKGIGIDTMATPLLLAGIFAMGVHSTFFGPVKYAILPQHLHPDEVLAGTGLVEAGTYVAILLGTILAGWIPVQWAALAVVLTALIGYASGRQVPPAPPVIAAEPLDWHLIRASWRLVRETMHDRRVFLAIMAISFFWMIGSVLFIQFPPLAKNVLGASKEVASLFPVVFSVGIAIGSASINALLKGKVSARFAPAAVLVMALFLVVLEQVCFLWTAPDDGSLLTVSQFLARPLAWPLLGVLLGVAVAGGMFVVPLYAFLTTFVSPSQTSRTIGANNIVNSAAMVAGSIAAIALTQLGVPIVMQLLLTAAMCLGSAWLGLKLYRAEEAAGG